MSDLQYESIHDLKSVSEVNVRNRGIVEDYMTKELLR